MKVTAIFLALTVFLAPTSAKKIHKKKHHSRAMAYPVNVLNQGITATITY